jgi:multidrug efflux pump subunit AcrB/outer membrane protein TolC
LSDKILYYRRITILIALFGFLFGIFQAFHMPKTEDPTIAKVGGMITIIYPGATPNEIEKYVLRPLETELIEVAALDKISSTVRSEVAIIGLRLEYNLSDEREIDKTWDEIRRAIDSAKKEFPPGVQTPELNEDILEKESIVLAFTSKKLSLMELKDQVDAIKDRFMQVPSVKKVIVNNDPGKQISVNIDDKVVSNLGLNYLEIVSQLQRSNRNIPAGSLKQDDKKILIGTNSTFKKIEELKEFPIVLRSGEVVNLRSIADIKVERELPQRNSMFLNGGASIGIGLVLKEKIDLIKYGEFFESQLDQIKRDYPLVQFHLVSYFPENVKNRIVDLSKSLLIGVSSLGFLLMLLMGVRVGLLVSLIVPIITFISLGIFSQLNGVLQQISISAFVMALGLLVDNVIVISESIQTKINEGITPLKASSQTIKEFLLPLFAATGTTIASFIPMLLAPGPAGQFTRSLAIVTVITLTTSYLFSVLVTPIIASYTLVSTKRKKSVLLKALSSRLGKVLVQHPLKVMIGIMFIFVPGMMSIPMLKVQFFPYADRDQLVIDLRLPEGTHFRFTENKVKEIYQNIRQSQLWKKEIVQIASYVGNSTPKFFYNLNLIPNSPHIAQMIVRVRDFSDSPRVRDELDILLSPLVQDGTLMIRELEQGPPVAAPVVVKVYSEDFETRRKTIHQIYARLLKIPAASNIRHDIGTGVPKIDYLINDTNAQQYGVTRSDVTSIILGRTRGLFAGDFRVDKNTVPILIKSQEGEEIGLDKLDRAFIRDSRSGSIDLDDLVERKLSFVPSSLHYERGRKVNTILIQNTDGYGYGDILSELKPFLASLNTKAEIELDGQGTESAKSNAQLIAGAPYALVVLILFLLIQFNSYKKFLIVFSSVPLSFIGLGPGHLLFGFPFGFFSLLGSLALIGIIVNNAILLIEFIDQKMKEGDPLEVAVERTLYQRLRPIFLTTLTTVIGILPLCFSDATLWPPFAWTIVFGLIFGSLLTVLFVPSFYALIYGPNKYFSFSGLFKRHFNLGALIICFSVLPDINHARSLKEVIQLSDQSISEQMARLGVEQVILQEKIHFRKTFFPGLGLQVEREMFNKGQSLSTPIGNLPFLSKNVTRAGVAINQKIFDLAEMIYEKESLKHSRLAMEKRRQRVVKLSRFQSAMVYLKAVELEIRQASLVQFAKNLRKRQREIKRLHHLGRVSDIDLLKVENALDETEVAISEIKAILPSVQLEIGRMIGESTPVLPNKTFDLADYPLVAGPTSIQRDDLQSLQLQMKAQGLKLKRIRASYLPNIDLELREYYQSPSQFADQRWRSLAIVFKWDLFKRGTRNAQKQIELNRLNQLKLKHRDLKRAVKIQQTEAIELKKNRYDNISKRKKTFNRALKAVQLESSRYSSGKSSLNDLLDAEVLLRDSRERKDLSVIEYLKAYFQYEVAL